MPRRIALADDHRLFRSSLRKLLESKPDFQIVGEATSGTEAVDLIQEHHPDILFLDVRLPGLSGLDVVEQIGSSSSTHVILITASIDRDEVARALKYGARGILLKDCEKHSLFDSVTAVLAGEYFVYRYRLPDLDDALRLLSESRSKKIHKNKCNLTRRELDVLEGMVSGYANKEIARQLCISEQTVKHHVTNIFNKTGTSNRLEVTVFAVEEGLYKVPSALTE